MIRCYKYIDRGLVAWESSKNPAAGHAASVHAEAVIQPRVARPKVAASAKWKPAEEAAHVLRLTYLSRSPGLFRAGRMSRRGQLHAARAGELRFDAQSLPVSPTHAQAQEDFAQHKQRPDPKVLDVFKKRRLFALDLVADELEDPGYHKHRNRYS